jgi:ribosomal protein L21E
MQNIVELGKVKRPSDSWARIDSRDGGTGVQIRQRLKEAHDRQKSYVDAHRIDQSYKVGDQVFIRIRSNKSTIRFEKGTKLSPRFIGPF